LGMRQSEARDGWSPMKAAVRQDSNRTLGVGPMATAKYHVVLFRGNRAILGNPVGFGPPTVRGIRVGQQPTAARPCAGRPCLDERLTLARWPLMTYLAAR